jgi:hypothetical protein
LKWHGERRSIADPPGARKLKQTFSI